MKRMRFQRGRKGWSVMSNVAGIKIGTKKHLGAFATEVLGVLGKSLSRTAGGEGGTSITGAQRSQRRTAGSKLGDTFKIHLAVKGRRAGLQRQMWVEGKTLFWILWKRRQHRQRTSGSRLVSCSSNLFLLPGYAAAAQLSLPPLGLAVRSFDQALDKGSSEHTPRPAIKSPHIGPSLFFPIHLLNEEISNGPGQRHKVEEA